MSTVIEAELDGDMEATALVSQQTMMQTRSSYSTAMQVQRPRSLAKVEKALLDEARHAGESFYYGWGAGGNKVEGPSQELAHAMARCWGNCAVEPGAIQETADSWIVPAGFVDLETGFTLVRQFRQSKKWTVHGKFDAERKDDVRFQIGQSKAARNVILKALPKWLANKAMEEAKAGVRKKIEDYINRNGLPAAVDYTIKTLEKEGVKEERVLLKFELADRRGLTIDHLVTLKGDIHAIQNGLDWPDALFPGGEPETKVKRSKLNDEPSPPAGAAPTSGSAAEAAPAGREPGDDGDPFEGVDEALAAAIPKGRAEVNLVGQQLMGTPPHDTDYHLEIRKRLERARREADEARK